MPDSTVTLVGTLGRDPEIRFTAGGRAVANFSIAVNRRYQQNGEWQEQTSWFNVTCWADLAENVAASLVKGSRAIVAGRLEQREWEDKEGNKRTTVEIVADEVGPSLRWATAQVDRTERKSGGASGGGARPDQVYGDEEPW